MVQYRRHQFRSTIFRYVEEPGAKIFRFLGIPPTLITVLGGAITLTAAIFIGYGYIGLGAIIFLVGSILDMMDGAVARLTQSTTKFGGILDSVMDRLSEASIFIAISIYAIRSDIGSTRLLILIVLVFLSLVFSQMVSYLRAKGESLGIETSGGLMTRPERIIVLFIGLIINLRVLEISLIVISTISCFTVFQRLFDIKRGINASQVE